jgi:hypothetical protein
MNLEVPIRRPFVMRPAPSVPLVERIHLWTSAGFDHSAASLHLSCPTPCVVSCPARIGGFLYISSFFGPQHTGGGEQIWSPDPLASIWFSQFRDFVHPRLARILLLQRRLSLSSTPHNTLPFLIPLLVRISSLLVTVLLYSPRSFSFLFYPLIIDSPRSSALVSHGYYP